MKKKRFIKMYLQKFLIFIFVVILLLLGQAGFSLSDFFNNSSGNSYVIQNDKTATGSLDKVQFVRVIDGDTIVVINASGEEDKVRLLEIDTPESVASQSYLESTGKTNCDEGQVASDFTKEIFANREHVYLEYDQEKEDKYGRTLAYVWLNGDVDVDEPEDISNYCLNAILLKNGMAECVIYEPNDRHEKLFMMLEEEAKQQQLGLWAR